MALRNVAMRRELSVIRRSHETTQLAFERLEKFVWDAYASPRWPVLTLSPAVGLPPLLLSTNNILTQRIPNDTSGLSDLAIFVSKIDSIKQGILTLQLEALESGDIISKWQVNSSKLTNAEWARFSLLRTLSLDKQTVLIRLTWSGDVPIEVASSLNHPDPRFNSHIDDFDTKVVIALKCWKHIEGVLTPLPSDGLVPVDQYNIDFSGEKRLLVDLEKLAEVININPINSEVSFDPHRTGVLVHPPKVGISIGRIDNCFTCQVTQVSAVIETVNEKGPTIEYCIALGHRSLRELNILDDSHFPDNAKSSWVSLQPNHRSQVSMYLADIDQNLFDLYLMTRLPVGCMDNSYGWSIFKEISAVF